jgi:hypothetical protein
MNLDIVCQFHHDLRDGMLVFPAMYPTVLCRDADRKGWRQTTNRYFSYDGSPIWICPDCAKWLDDWPKWEERNRLQRLGLFFIWQMREDSE